MKSSTGEYFIALDHIRALAAFLVFAWHFNHFNSGQVAPPPIFPLSLLAEGHTGVALFMTLSGYIFAKLLNGQSINYLAFLFNRIIRIAPMLIFALWLYWYLNDVNTAAYLNRLMHGLYSPSWAWPNGAWSIAVELHFYLILPFLLLSIRKWKYSLLAILIAAVAYRYYTYSTTGSIQILAYWTIIGHIDQFLLGILAYQFRHLIIKNT